MMFKKERFSFEVEIREGRYEEMQRGANEDVVNMRIFLFRE